MTLSLAVMTHAFACAVTDRRVSDQTGMPLDDEFDKTCTPTTTNARVAVSFCGLAKARRFHSHVNLIERLESCAPPECTLLALLARLRDTLSTEFLQNREIKNIPRYLRKFSVMFVGFGYNVLGRSPTFGLISNFQDIDKNVAKEAWDRFELFNTALTPDVEQIGLAIGDTGALASGRFTAPFIC
jgi:hypothetical protein